MKTMIRKTMPKPNTISRQVPRTRTAAATEMVRLEFERDRIMRDLTVLDERRQSAQTTLENVNRRLRSLQNILQIENTGK